MLTKTKFLDAGQIITSPGGLFKYKVLGAVCPLFDRELLPYPSCSLSYKSKQPSWRRIGRRFVPDVACVNVATYSVQLLDAETQPQILTLFWQRAQAEPDLLE